MKDKMIMQAITAMIVLSTAQISLATDNNMGATPDGMEKCYGVAKAGRNDCSTASLNCAGESKIEANRNAWVLTPKGLCDKLVNGQLTPATKNR